MARSQANDHYQEDTRCGYCLEEWPCEGSATPWRPSGVHKWKNEETNKQYEEQRRFRRIQAMRLNHILAKLGVLGSETSQMRPFSRDPGESAYLPIDVFDRLMVRLAVHENIEIITEETIGER